MTLLVPTMRMKAKILFLAGLGLCLTGLFFGRASWVGVNNHSIATWFLMEWVGAILVISGLALRFIRKHD